MQVAVAFNDLPGSASGHVMEVMDWEPTPNRVGNKSLEHRM